jgi:hypothetical protein
MAGSLKKARSRSFLIHAGYLLMLVLLLLTNNWVFAFSGLLLALAGFYLTHEAARCPKCSGALLEGGNGLSGALNLLLLTTGKPITCRFCQYETQGRDYA